MNVIIRYNAAVVGVDPFTDSIQIEYRVRLQVPREELADLSMERVEALSGDLCNTYDDSLKAWGVRHDVSFVKVVPAMGLPGGLPE